MTKKGLHKVLSMKWAVLVTVLFVSFSYKDTYEEGDKKITYETYEEITCQKIK